PRHLPELALERRGDRGGHDIWARAGVEGHDLDRGVVHLRQGGQRELAVGDDAGKQNGDHQQGGRDGPQDERPGRAHSALSATGRARAARSRTASFGTLLPAPFAFSLILAGFAAAFGACVATSFPASLATFVFTLPPGALDAGRLLLSAFLGHVVAAFLPPPAFFLAGVAVGRRLAGFAVGDLDLSALAQPVGTVGHHQLAGLEAGL